MKRFAYALLLIPLLFATFSLGQGAQAATAHRLYIPAAPKNGAAPRNSPLAFGAGVIDNNFELVKGMNFPWIKLNINMSSSSDPTSLIDSARSRYPGVKILVRLDQTPAAWQTGIDANPIRADLFGAYLRNLTSRLRGKVQAYELFNEPNLKFEWNTYIAGGGGYPSVPGYVRILQTAYPAIKAGDPDAIVITGGLSSAGGGGSQAIGDIDYIGQLYANGAYGYFDAVGTHPYGGACTFDAGGCSEDIFFRRAETQYGRMLQAGDTTHQMWATELGWLVDPRLYGHPECMAPLGGRAGWVRSPADVANQLVAAYNYAAANWPWMGGMFFFNFDYSAAGWVTGYDKVCDAPSWYSIVSKNNMPGRPYVEPAYDALTTLGRQFNGTR